jgi:hypothetical protein
MSKKITFGSSEAYLISDFNIKQKVVDYLYGSINLSKLRFKMLNNIQYLEFLKENEHYVSPSFKGFNYFLIFMNIDDKKYCVALDRRKLNYHKDQVDMKSIFIVRVIAKVNESIFNGTIFDGKLIESKEKFIFLIQDCLYLMGKKITDLDMEDKLIQLDTVLKLHFPNNSVCENFTFKLNKLCKYNELEKLITETIPNCSIPCNGLVFFPKKSGTSIIHIEKKIDKINIETNQVDNKIVESKTYDMIYNFVEYLKSRTYSYEKGNKKRQFWLSRTNIPDVYSLCEKQIGEKNGIAHIPNIKISHLCNSIIKDEPVKFDCVFHTKFKKWIPINPIN